MASGFAAWKHRRFQTRYAAQASVTALAGFTGRICTGVLINCWLKDANDPTEAVENVKETLPAPMRLVGFEAVGHRFAF